MEKRSLDMVLRRLAIVLPFYLFTFLPLHAQYEKMGGVYYAYPVTETVLASAPEGFEPIYISHYGRHGSRWVTSDKRYIWVNQQFEDQKNLTKLGKSLRKRLQKVWKNAQGNGGKLTPLGGRQHRGIAHRMYQNLPQLFTAEARLTAHSSVVGRCKSSMENFVSELKSLNPSIQIDPVTREEDMDWIAYTSPEQKALEQRTNVPLKISPERFVKALFIDPSKVEDPTKLLLELHTIASDMQDVELDISLYDLYTMEEMEAVYAKNNEGMTTIHGDVIQNEGIPARSAISLWQRIEADADAAIARGGVGADLRFGHDSNLFRLMNLMQIAPKDMPMDELLPMAANLQMIFYRNAQGDVIVQLLHNEQSMGFKNWKELKQQVSTRIHELEHLRQLCALNTMVGTAPANTKTAGLFGKGSEEHGQTLPAVLAPNGQNFWTPQTQDTEKKCIAPYYYTDSLLQGFRNSHWIVGGCTQDYGSFTLAALGGQLRLRPAERATPFSHAEEISHPHYYAVRLPQEHLKVEMTGSSHTAIFRITPEQDGPVHIILNHNSDEGEGYLEINQQDKTIYGYNPVHRIYQGWGEHAGFDGHYLLQAYDEIEDSGCDSLCAWFTFRGKAHEPIILKAATSFISKRGAEDNFAFEAEGHDFDSMMEQLAQQWMDRLHTIDVEDPDTARVNQFYGALYRCSFLPHEMSDVDGTYPSFANGELAVGKRKYYGDYSMWDTYRAVHPLYNIIAPQQSADMMQSLVTMYEQGGWLPIFPCWNSYTAAMIGDHCSVVLADAYVKGIRDFNVEKAYEGMRKNAFETPASFEDYKNGMGRRALPSYLKYGYIPLEDGVKEAFHQDEQTSRTLEYAFDDFAVAQLAKTLGKDQDYQELMRRSENWRNVINPKTGYCDGRHEPKQISKKKTDGGKFEDNLDFIHRKPYITEGATCHYTWYVPQNVEGLVEMLGGKAQFEAKLDSMFTEGRYWHGNEPCHQIAYLYDFIGKPEKTAQRVAHILDTEYNDTPGGLSGNDDAGQMSAWYVFSSMGFYPVCPATDRYMLTAPRFQKVTLNLQNDKKFVITPTSLPKDRNYITHGEILQGN
ncbi:MAG: GH92 family glycosyl hydrolase [Prevotella sp.]|nr:GH92 family glycosyl hydrolase [Prevotella sp.]